MSLSKKNIFANVETDSWSLIWSFLLIFTFAIIAGVLVAWEENIFWGILAGVISLFLLVLLIRYERFGLYLLIAILPLEGMLRVDWMSTSLLIIPGAFALMGWIVSVLWRRRKIFIQSPSLFLALSLAIWASFATAVVGSVSEARPYWLVFVLIFLVPNLLTQKEHLLRATWVFILPLGAIGLYMLVNRLGIYLANPNISAELFKPFVSINLLATSWETLSITISCAKLLFFCNASN